MDFNKPHEECGVFGFYDNNGLDCAIMTYYALYALQHRGQESCGIAVNDDGVIYHHKDRGLVPEVFNDAILDKLKGNMAVGHVRYSQASRGLREDAQPLVTKYIKGSLAVVYNGSIVNAPDLLQELGKSGAIFQTKTDAELITYLLAQDRVSSHTVEVALSNVMQSLKGSYSLIIMTPHKLIAARDPLGMKPLSIGKIDDSYAIASETVAFDNIHADFVRDVLPGEIVVIDETGIHSITDNCPDKDSAMCIFEYIYFARPDSVIEGQSIYEARKNAGKLLAKKNKVEADIVFGIPDSGLCAAIGYAEESGIPYGYGLMKNRYVGRTFIQPKQSVRERNVNIKLNVQRSSVEGKRVVVVDDSIVRGTTVANLVKLLKNAGAKEVHMRVSSPPFICPCYFGTDIPSREGLIACHNSVEEIRQIIDADSLGFLDVDDLPYIIPQRNVKGYCDACFSGNYPMDVPDEKDKLAFERRNEI